ncbi:PREDICTED: mitogen-activated protein kinase kinase kinase A-like [Prunus mume]|uniref:mitogen-activated protein kinase kinase kinase n=1 Tax=Prunus mume TaxID=102107 RepID=A0ABM0N820_PRUMU|nr:PREDICTED: mitogen-activated protein kinase kinase kinase A-like [Prunus mume]
MSSSSSFSLHKPSTTASASAAASSCSVSVLKQDRGDSCEQAPGRLMRQRKLRYLSNLDLSFSSSSLTSPEHSSPLPLTESPVIGRSNSVHTYRNQIATTSATQNSNSSVCQGTLYNGGGFSYNMGLNAFSRTTQANRIASHPLAPQRPDIVCGFPIHVATTSSINRSSICQRRMPEDLDCGYEGYNFSRSAPTRPSFSPRRSNAMDPFPTFGVSQEQYQDSYPSRLQPNNPHHSPSHISHPHSPTSRSLRFNHESSNGNAFALHDKSFTERAESSRQVHAHPLPLPPGAVEPPKSSIMHHNAELVSTSSMKAHWQKGKLIGRGTFARVYLATNRDTGALCAMKEVDLIPDDPKFAECIKQLEQEIEVLRTLNHLNIVQYYGSEVIDDHFYMYLEYVHPGSINKYVQDHIIGAMTESVVRNFTRHILYGLAFLHSKKIVHRDIKGANLCVDTSGVVKIAGFGMAKRLNGQSNNLSLKGSPYWMAPEVVIQNNPDLGLAVDIWSLGCTIIEMLNGKPPWSDFTGPQAMFKVLDKIPDIPETLSAEGRDFLSRCFRRNPAERPSANQLLKHPFVLNSHDQTISHYAHNFSLMNLDNLHSPIDQTKLENGRRGRNMKTC